MTPEGPFFTEKEPLALSPGATNPDMLGMTPDGPFFTEKEPLALSPGATNPGMLGMTPDGEILHFVQDDTEDRSVLSKYRSAVS